MSWRATLIGALGGLVLTASHAVARADEATCIADHAAAQRLRSRLQLKQARRTLMQCAAASCPGMVREDCTRWLDDVDRTIPSVVFSARDQGDNDLSDVTVSLGGRVLTPRLDGRAIELDPGAYELRFERAGQRPIDVKVVLSTGVKSRVVQVTFPGGKPKAAKPPTPIVAWVLAGTGVVALGSFTYFALSGQRDYDQLESDCSPRCDPRDSDPVRQKFLIADISLAVAGVSFAGATYFFLTAPGSRETAKAPVVRVQPTSRGGFASVFTRF